MPGRPSIWIRVGQGPTALAVGAGGGCLDIFTLIYPFCHLSPSLWETARYRLKYCLKGPLNPKTTNQPTSDWTIGGANYAVLFVWTAYANDSQQVITVSSHFKFVLIVVVPVGFVSTDFCAKVACFC